MGLRFSPQLPPRIGFYYGHGVPSTCSSFSVELGSQATCSLKNTLELSLSHPKEPVRRPALKRKETEFLWTELQVDKPKSAKEAAIETSDLTLAGGLIELHNFVQGPVMAVLDVNMSMPHFSFLGDSR